MDSFRYHSERNLPKIPSGKPRGNGGSGETWPVAPRERLGLRRSDQTGLPASSPAISHNRRGKETSTNQVDLFEGQVFVEPTNHAPRPAVFPATQHRRRGVNLFV